MTSRSIFLFILTFVILGCDPTPTFQQVELLSQTIFEDTVEKKIIYWSKSKTKGSVNHEFYYDFPDTTNKYHFVVTYDSSNQLNYFGELLTSILTDTFLVDGTEQVVSLFRYNLENTLDEETDIYVNNGLMILEHSTAWSTLYIYNYDSTTKHLNQKLVATLKKPISNGH